MMRRALVIIAMVLSGCVLFPTRSFASPSEEGGEINVQHIIFEHMLDSYSWHITKVGEKDIVIYLPVILHSKTSGWHIFSSRRLHENGGSYEGFYPAPEDGPHAYKLMEKMPDGSFVRPLDLSLTKMSLALLINGAILLLLFLPAARAKQNNINNNRIISAKRPIAQNNNIRPNNKPSQIPQTTNPSSHHNFKHHTNKINMKEKNQNDNQINKLENGINNINFGHPFQPQKKENPQKIKRQFTTPETSNQINSINNIFNKQQNLPNYSQMENYLKIQSGALNEFY